MPDLAGRKVAYFSFTGPIGPDQATKIAASFNGSANAQFDEVYLCLNSPGGLTGDAVFLYNLIRSLPVSVTMHNIGNVSSAAVTVFVAAEKRYCSPRGSFLIHPTTMGPFSEGMAWERLDSTLKAALAEDQRIEDILRERTSLPTEMLSQRRVRDVTITPDFALAHGLIDEIREFTLPKGNQIFQI